MINAFEFMLRDALQDFWQQVIAAIGTPTDIVPDIFAGLPASGDFGANWAAIADNFRRMATGNTQDDLTFMLEYPTAKQSVPCVTIEVGKDYLEEVVGDFVQEGIDDTGRFARHVGGPWTKTYGLGIYSYNADTTLYLYSLVKYGLLILRNQFDSSIGTISMDARPLQVIYPNYTPEPLYVRYLDIEVTGVIDTAIQRFDTVKGTQAIATTVEDTTEVIVGFWANTYADLLVQIDNSVGLTADTLVG